MTYTSDQYLTMAEMSAERAETAADGNAPNTLLAQVFTGLASAYATAAQAAAIREATEVQRQISEVRVGLASVGTTSDSYRQGPKDLEQKTDRPPLTIETPGCKLGSTT